MIDKFGSFFKSELTGWSRLEVVWFCVASAVILCPSLYWRDTWIGIVSALTGVWCAVLTGQGKRSSFIFGTINVVLYALLSFKAKYYGEVMLNLFYYLPMNFVGWFVWKKHMNEDTGEVDKERMDGRKGLLVCGLTAVGIVAFGFVLKALGGNLPFINSMTTVISVTAQILSLKRLAEQWVLWIVVDVLLVGMWAVHFAQGQENVSMFVMSCVYLLNAIFMYVRWLREAKRSL